MYYSMLTLLVQDMILLVLVFRETKWYPLSHVGHCENVHCRIPR